MRNKRLIPTEPYPLLLWYQEKRIPCTPKQIITLTNIYTESAIILLEKTHKTASKDKIRSMAKEIAATKVEIECNKPTSLRKMVVNTYAEHMEAKEMIESSENFLKWYTMENNHA